MTNLKPTTYDDRLLKEVDPQLLQNSTIKTGIFKINPSYPDIEKYKNLDAYKVCFLRSDFVKAAGSGMIDFVNALKNHSLITKKNINDALSSCAMTGQLSLLIPLMSDKRITSEGIISSFTTATMFGQLGIVKLLINDKRIPMHQKQQALDSAAAWGKTEVATFISQKTGLTANKINGTHTADGFNLTHW